MLPRDCRKRDPKGLYRKAEAGEIKDLTGPQDPYEEPENPKVIVDTELLNADESAKSVLDRLKHLGYLA